MDTKNFRMWEYEWMVWKKAVMDTVAFYQTNKLAAFGNILGSLLTLFYVYIRGGIRVMNDQLLVIEATVFGFVGTSIFYLLVHRLSAPVVLYRNKEKEASKYNWDDIVIDKTEIKDNKTLMALGIRVKNNKVYDLGRVIAQIQYLEIDGQPSVEDRQRLQTQRGRRLGWLWNSHRMSVTEQSLDKNGYEAVIDLFRIMPNQISFFELIDERNEFVPVDINVNNIVKGEILFLAGFSAHPAHPEWIPIEYIYNFTIILSDKEKPKMIFGKGRMYKPPEIER